MRKDLLALAARCGRWLVLAVALFLPYLGCVHYTSLGTVGLERNQVTGVISLDHPGWNFTPPWVWVAKLDVRPQRVCLTTTARAFNCRLVQFNPAAAQEFVATEGWRYYWWSNRFSWNTGYDEEYRGWRDVLRGYAYGSKPYPFVTVLREYQEGE